MTKPFLLEIGVEEVPAHVVKPSAEALRDALRALLEEARLLAPGAGVTCAGTPRRLVAEATGVLERQEDRVVAGFGVNLAHSPDMPGRETAALSSVALVSPEAFAPLLAAAFTRELARWRGDPQGLAALWLESAHPVGTPLSVHLTADEKIDGRFAGLAQDGALRLSLPGGEERCIHAADVMLGGA